MIKLKKTISYDGDERKPAGVYNCPECRDVVIIWRSPVDKYKTKCPKCGVDMVRVAGVPQPVAQEYTAGPRRLGNPRTEAERKARHKRLHPKTALPPRGTGLKTSDVHNLDKLAEMYKRDENFARVEAARQGININEVVMYESMKSVLTGWKLGVQHGEAEAAGTRAAPGAVKLLILQMLHGKGYVTGRQKGLGGKHGGTRSKETVLGSLPEVTAGAIRG